MDILEDFERRWAEIKADIITHPHFKHFGVKRYNETPMYDGVAFSCELTFKGQKVAEAYNHGCGGPDMILYRVLHGKPAWKELCELAKDMPEPESVVLDCILSAHGK